jgi:hypothetical protein
MAGAYIATTANRYSDPCPMEVGLASKRPTLQEVLSCNQLLRISLMGKGKVY